MQFFNKAWELEIENITGSRNNKHSTQESTSGEGRSRWVSDIGVTLSLGAADAPYLRKCSTSKSSKPVVDILPHSAVWSKQKVSKQYWRSLGWIPQTMRSR